MNQENRLYASASELLDRLTNEGVEISAPVDVDLIASKLNIIVQTDFSLDAKGVVGEIQFENDVPVVRINPAENSYEPRRRFTLAHEIGHYCLHSAKSRQGFTDSRKTMSRTESYWDKYESEANNFAAQLLMPKSLIIQEGQLIIDRYKVVTKKDAIPASTFVELMADKFKVSSKAMEYRLKNLGVLGQPAPTPVPA